MRIRMIVASGPSAGRSWPGVELMLPSVAATPREGVMSKTDLIRSLYGAFAQGDVPTVLGAMDPGIAWNEAEGNPYRPGDGSPFVGPDAIVQGVFAPLASEWEGFAVTPQTFSESGDRVFVEGRYGGVYRATGKSLDAPFLHAWTLSGDKVTHYQQYTDTAHMREVMGI